MLFSMMKGTPARMSQAYLHTTIAVVDKTKSFQLRVSDTSPKVSRGEPSACLALCIVGLMDRPAAVAVDWRMREASAPVS